MMIGWLQITSGRGPEECCWVVAQLAKAIINEASAKGYKAHVLETIPGITPNIFKSALIAIEGENIPSFVSTWEGTIQWIGNSMFRPNHKRKNWFVGVNFLNPPQEKDLKLNDVKIETMRSSGAGGQHVNKTESAVRVTHIATGIIAVAREERSQHLNRKLALSRLYEKLKQEKDDMTLKQQQDRWTCHNRLERGNPIRIYEGMNFKRRSE
ncbi:MAG: peptide chain release factor H [Desulfobacteraceae bacterium IS3]|jgi:peptide chain release factor|nr:MAG: peptide chain release factor H [Desulfobacteraceae bacterium IS3]